jgi:ADP-heptose:LPS heptosyltransferase
MIVPGTLEWAADHRRPARVAVLRALALGDTICALPFLATLRQGLPAAEITLIGLPWSAAFLERFPSVDRHLAFPGFPGIPEVPIRPAEIAAFLDEARREPFDLAIQLQGNGLHSNGFLALLGARLLAGFYLPGEWRPEGAFVPYPDHGREDERLISLAPALGLPGEVDRPEIPVLAADRLALARVLGGLGVSLEPGTYAVVHPGATLPARRWSTMGFAAVADRLVAAGLTVVLTGGPEEGVLTAAVRQAMRGPAIDLGARTDLGALMAALAGARVVVCNDTGVSHLAAGLRTPSVIVFLASNPDRWAPADPDRHRSVGTGLPNRCDVDERGVHRCLADGCRRPGAARPSPVTADAVSSAALDLVGRWSASAA